MRDSLARALRRIADRLDPQRDFSRSRVRIDMASNKNSAVFATIIDMEMRHAFESRVGGWDGKITIAEDGKTIARVHIEP